MAVRQTKAGTWETRFRGPDGRERSKTFRTKLLADRYEREARTDAGRGIDVQPRGGHISLSEWAPVCEAAQAHLSPSSRERYAGIVRNYIVPAWGFRPLNRIGHADVQAWVSELAATMSPASARKVYGVLSGMLNLAVRDKRLSVNAAKGVNLPRVTKASHRYLTHQQVAGLAEQMGERKGLIALVLAYCGLRWGELAALRIADVDFLRRRLSVTRSVSDVNGALIWGPTKTYQHRSVPFPRFLAEPLARYCRGRDLTELLFPSRSGTALRVKNFRRDDFDEAATRAGLGGLHPHELRHTAASLAIASGANVKAVQTMLGHAQASMTLDVYADLFPDDLDRVSEALDEARAKSLAGISRASGQSGDQK
jgi:integrase